MSSANKATNARIRKNFSKISFSKNDELEILCIPPWLIEKVDTEIDHFHYRFPLTMPCNC